MKIKRIVIFLILLLSLLVISCVDNASSIQHCHKLGLQYTGKIFGCDVECINATTGQLYRFEGECRFIRKWTTYKEGFWRIVY